jgi:HEPN domain-containing protein
MSNRNPDPAVWLRLARDDMATVRLLMTEHRKRVEIILYHCQQTAEKSLKAYLIDNNVWIGNTHDLVLLLRECISINPSFNLKRMINHCAFLNRITPGVKYADLNMSFDTSHIPRAINSAKRIYDLTSVHLGMGKHYYK